MSSTRSCSSSSTSNSNSNMPERRTNSSRRTSESSSSLGSTTAVSTTSSSSSSARQQHVADKSAVKRKKRRKDEDDERVPVVRLTRLEDERKAIECKVKRVTEVKVVVERTCDIESIRAASAIVVGKKSTRHPVHRSSEDLAIGDAKATEATRVAPAVVEGKKSIRHPVHRSSENLDIGDAKATGTSIVAPAVVAGKKNSRQPVHRSSENLANGDAKATEAIRAAPTVVVDKKSTRQPVHRSSEDLANDDAKATKTTVAASAVVAGKKSTRQPVHRSSENLVNGDAKGTETTRRAASAVVVDRKSTRQPVHKSSENLSNGDAKVTELIAEPIRTAPAVVADKKSTRHPVHRSSENLANGDAKTTEPIRAAAAVVDGKKKPRHSVHRSSENFANGDAKTTEPIREMVEMKVAAVVVEDTVKALPKKVVAIVVEDAVKAPPKKVVAVVVEDTVKAPPKKSIESAKSSESRSSKVKSDRKPADRSTERNVHNVNNDNNRKTIDPKITERRLLVKLDRSEVQNYLAAQRLHAEETEVADKSDKYHSESENQDDDVAPATSTEITTCAITSDDGEIQKDSVEKPTVDDVTDRLEEVQKTDATNKVKKAQKTDVTNKVKDVEKTNVIEENQKTDVEKPPVESAKRRGRPRKNKDVEEPAKSVVINQRPSSSREKRRAKSQDTARKSNKANSDKDLGDDTKIHEDSSVQVNKNQTEHSDESPKDTSCESAKSSLSSESLNESAVVDSEQVSSETPETDKISNKIIESNSGSDNDSSVIAAAEPVPLPMEVDEIPHEHTVVDDSKAESESAQQICDIHSKSVDEDAETLTEEAETVDKSKEEVLPEQSTENLVDESSESPLENLVSSDTTECPAKNSEENETCESPAKNISISETSENLVNGEIESPADSFVSCENAESTNEESTSGELIETLEDTESIASTCTLIEETPEDLSKELDAQEDLPEDVEKPTDEPAEEDAHKEPEMIKELPEVAADKEEDTSLKTDKLDESFSSTTESNEHESTFENNLKSVENLVIDSILNGEIVSPKMIVPSAASRVEQSFVFEGGVEDFVADIEVTKAVSLVSSTPVEEVPSLENLEPSPVVEAPPVAENLAPSVPIEESTLVESSVPLEEPAETLPVEPLPSIAQHEPAAEEETLESPPVTEEASEPAALTEEPPVDEEFAKHRRKQAISELKKKCEENIDRREALEEACNNKADHEEEQQPPLPSTFGVVDVGDLQVPSDALASSDCYPEPPAVSSDNYFENISDADSEICLADRLNQLADLKIPSLEETLPSENSAMSDFEESSPTDPMKRQRILMKITKTDVNKHVTHLVESKEEEETLPSNNEQFAADQVTEGEIKIIMRKESSSNNHVIKEIKIIPRTPEGNNSARIPGYSPTSSDLSSGNSSCRVPSCSPAKPDSGSYRMPGWSPASTETGQTMATATTKKKQGRPKKYPIFTDAELIAKTTAIVNNGDVHVASKLADKPLFEPVESIRINEDDEVEQDDDDEEEHQTVITEQTCLSGSQLLDAMPAQPEIAAELTRKIQEDQNAAKKKKGRPRKYPLPEDEVGTKSENVSVARIEFNVVDSIEEFVEPVKQIPSRPVSPVKKRGRPRKYPLESAETSAVEECDTIVESVLIHEVPSDKKARKPRLFVDDVERRSCKPFKTLKDLLNKSPEIRPADDVDSQTEDEAPVVEPYVERRGRKPWKHLKDLRRAADRDNSTAENEVASDASPTKPYVERRGRKPWKHLKELNKLSESQVAENSTTENEAASDASPVKAYVERRGRKPWKHLKNAKALGENQVADDADSQTEDEAQVAAPYVERRGRKPWKHLKNLDKSLENQGAQQDMSTTENDAVSDASLTKVERRGRKPWKHLKNLDKSSENQAAEDADSQTEDESPATAPYVERRGRKPWKHLKNLDKSSENQVAEDADSQTEDEAPATAPYVERRGRKPWKHLKHANESSENQVAERENPTVENNATPTKIERRGRKPWKHLKDADNSESQDAEETNSQTEDETIQENLETERSIKKRRRRKSQKLAELADAEGATSMTEDESADDTPYAEKENTDVSSAEKTSSVTDNESAEAKPYVERRGRKPKYLKDPNKSTENAIDEGTDSQTEDEGALVAAPYVEKRGRKPKHLKNLDNSSESQATEQDMSTTETDVVSDASLIKIAKRGRPKKLKKLPLPLGDGEKRKRGRPRLYPRLSLNQAAEERNSVSLQDVQTAEKVSLINEDESAKDDSAIEPVVQEKVAASESSQDDETAISENIVTEKPASNTENEIGSDTPLAEVIVKKKRSRKHLKDSEDTTVTSVAEEENFMTEDESADEDALVGEQADKPAVVSSPEKKKRGRPPKVQPEAEVLLPENQATEEASSMTEDVPNVKKRGRPRKLSQDDGVPEIPAVAQDTNPVTEDETVSSTEDIPTSDNVAEKRAKSVSPIKIARNQVLEQPSSQTEDETVSSTEDIPAVEQQPQQQQPIVKKVKFAGLPSDSSSTSSGSSVENSTMEPPVVVKKRGRPPKIARIADSTNDSVDNTTEDETVSSTEDIPTGEQHIKKKQGRPKKNFSLPSFELETMNNSLAASSVEDLSTLDLPAPKKRGRKPHPRPLEGDENSSIAASSMEDLSTLGEPIVVKKKRGRKPRALVQNDSTCSDSMAASSMEDLSRLVPPPILVKKRGRPPKIPRLPTAGDLSADSMEEFSPMKQVQFAAAFGHSIFDVNQQVVHDRSLSPVKKRGRPPKYPRENIEAPKRVSIVENPEIISTPASDQQQPVLEKRKGRLPRRLSQDENFLPSILRSDKLMGRRASHDSGIIPAFSLSDGAEVVPSLGKRQGRPPRKFSPDEEHSFSTVAQPIVNHVQMENESPKKLGRPPIRKDDGLPSSVSDSDETSAKRRGRPPKKFAMEDGFTSGGETSPTKRRGRPPKSLQDASSPLPQPETLEPPQDVSLPPVVACVLSSSDDVKRTPTISTTNLLRQQRKPKMAQPQSISPPAIVQSAPQSSEPPPPLSPVKKRGRPRLLPTFDIGAKLQPDELPEGMTIEQLRRRRHSQDDSMFTAEARTPMLAARPKEFEDAQPRKKRGRPPKVRELPRPFVMEAVKPAQPVEEVVASIEDSPKLKERLNRPLKPPAENTVEEPTAKLTAADFLRTWTDRDESPAPQTTQLQPTKKPGTRQRRFSQDFPLDESSRPSSRNRLRRYSQGDAIDDTSNDELRFNARKRLRSSGSDSSIVHDDKRPRVERDLCDQHSITKELVVQLTKIDKGEESAPSTPIQQPQQPLPISSDLVRMNLRRKLESNNNSASEPPPLVPIEPNRLQPPTHSDAKLLMLMQPNEDKTTTMLQTPQQSMQPPTQQFCIIFIPDALTSSESSLSKDSQPTATIVNFQPVPDSELANKSVIYTPTTPTKIFVNSSIEEQQRHRSFLCTTCTQALDFVGRLEANMGMTEEDKCAIKCPFCSNAFQSVFYLEYHLRQEHLKCENERQCRHPGFNTLRIPSHDAAASESEIYITFALKCRSCYELFDGVHSLNEHVKAKHGHLIRLHKPAPLASGMICYPPPPPPGASSPFKNGARPELLHCPSDCICRVGIRSTDSPMQRAQMLKRCPNFMRRLEKIEAAAYEVYTCTLCKSTFLMKDEVVEHLMKMHEVACKFPCTKCLASFRSVQLQEAHHCSETTIRDLDKLLNIVIMPTDKSHEDSSNDELGPIKTTPPPAVPSASTPLNGVKRKNGIVIQRLTRFLAMQPPKKPRLEASAPGTPVTSKKRQKTPCPKCQKKFAYRKSLNDHIIFEHIIPCKADEASKNMAVELLRLVNNGGTDHAKIEELSAALGKYTDDEGGTSLKKLTAMDEQENWNEAQHDGERDMAQCVKCKVGFRVPNTANLARRSNHQRTQSPIPQLCDRCDPSRRRRNNAVSNGHKYNNARAPSNGDQIRYTYECIHCGESFPTTIELNSHKSREHSAHPSDAALKCDTCSKIFYSSRMLEKHKKLQHDSPASHDDDNNSLNSSRADDDDESMNCSLNNQSGVMDTSKDSEAALNDTANSSTTSRRDSSDGNNKDEEEACKCPRCDFSAEKVSLKNHLKREHGAMAFICQFCGKLLVEISEVRHMLDYHIKSSRKNGGVAATLSCGGDEVSELLRTLGKKRLQSLMIYHDFEGKCNNAIMRCPICPEQFATRESCRHHYQWMHDCTCILCDASFGGGNLAGQHKVAVHNSIASYVWAIQRLVSAIVHGLRLDRAHPSNVLYQEVSMRLDALEQQELIESEMLAAARASNKVGEENVVVVSEPFLEPVVLSEDQLPGSGNMIEVVIGNDMVVEDSEDNLLENFYLSPNYDSSCEQPRILDAGAPIPELEEEEEVVATTIAPMINTCAAIAMPATPSITTSNGGILIPTTPVTAETYATSAVFKLRQDNGQEEVVLAITDEDLLTYRDDIGSLAEKLSATCDSLSLEEITTMLRSYFENVGTAQSEEAQQQQQQQLQTVEQFANAVEPRTQ